MSKVQVEIDIASIIDGKRLSIREFARSVDHSFETIRKMYHGEMVRFPKELIAKIIEVYGVSIDELIIVKYNTSK